LHLLRDISRRLHATTDYVRFHATWKPWRDTLTPAPCYPAFLPWLLAPPDSTKHRMARFVFSSSRSTRRGTSAATEISVRDRRSVISLVDGTAVSTLSPSPVSVPVPALAAAASPPASMSPTLSLDLLHLHRPHPYPYLLFHVTTRPSGGWSTPMPWSAATAQSFYICLVPSTAGRITCRRSTLPSCVLAIRRGQWCINSTWAYPS